MRRAQILVLGILAGASASGCQTGAAYRPDALAALAGSVIEVVDLTHPLHLDIPRPAGAPLVMRERLTARVGGAIADRITLPDDAGTHVEAPARSDPRGATVDALRPVNLVAPLIVVDLVAEATANPDVRCTRERIEQFEAVHGRIPRDAVVVLHTGWAARWPSQARYANADAEDVPHHPSFDPEAVTFLVKNRSVRAIGIDTLALDWGGSSDTQVRAILHAAGRFGLLNLANLDRCPPTGAIIVIAPLPVAGAAAAPARVLALLATADAAPRPGP